MSLYSYVCMKKIGHEVCLSKIEFRSKTFSVFEIRNSGGVTDENEERNDMKRFIRNPAQVRDEN